jgi:uncharacterized protein YegL
MPRLAQADLETQNVGTFQFSGVRAAKLSASEYTIVTVAEDISGSIGGSEKILNECKIAAIKACQHSPRASYLLLRNFQFNHEVKPETHGFIPLADIDADKDYPVLRAGGGTALYDALYSGIASANQYGKTTLVDNDFACNAITFVITDGWDESSKMGVADILAELERVSKAEEIESHMVVLVGINASYCKDKLDKLIDGLQSKSLHKTFCQFVDAGDATPANLAKLASFISKSISSQSSSLGTGGPSQPLTI